MAGRILPRRVVQNGNLDVTDHLVYEYYDAPIQFIGQKVEVSSCPRHWGAYIPYGPTLGQRGTNSRTKRKAAISSGYAKEDCGDIQ